MRWVVIASAAGSVAGALKLNRTARQIAVLSPSYDPVSPGHRFVCAPGVELDEATKRAASRYAREHDLEVLDLWPDDLPAASVAGELSRYSAAARRRNKLAAGYSPGYAVLIADAVAERAQPPAFENRPQFRRWAARLGHYAARREHAIAPTLRALDDNAVMEAKSLQAQPQAAGLLLLLKAAGAAFPVFAALKYGWAGVGMLLATQLRPALATAGSALRPRGLAEHSLIGNLKRIAGLPKTARLFWQLPGRGEAKRDFYAKALSQQNGDWFKPRADACPICGSEDLQRFIASHDVLLVKPGHFTLDECRSCGHIFQNPQLTDEGLSFYYQDAYDGLNESATDMVFGGTPGMYRERASRVKSHATPSRWLDIGGGHGHFCAVAQEVWPETEFDVLDRGETVSEAEAKGWVRRSYCGRVQDFMTELKGTYDVVSMFHYLEHTTDPRTELQAVRSMLKPGGLLLLEVPNPNSTFNRVLGRYWFSWFQPQHLNLINQANFERLFKEAGFEPVVWHWKESHLPMTFWSAALVRLNGMAPIPGLPWRPRPGTWERIRFHAIWMLGLPVVLGAAALDMLCYPFLARPGRSYNYGVLARRI